LTDLKALPMRFDELGLAPELLRAIADKGYTEPTPIQAQAIPLVLAGKDLMGGAQTGTGKTAAFTLPLLQRILAFASPSPSPARHPVRVLMLAPTRELAIQVHESVKTYSRHVPIRSACVFGGVDIKPQIAEIRCGVEVLVATPGRLLDLVEQKCLNFGSVQALVLDEADRMLDMGFVPDVTRIINMLPRQRQSLLFSATFSEEIKKLADGMLQSPVLIEVAKRNTVSETITHRVHPVAAEAKRALLVKLLKSADFNQVLVFTRTKIETNRLARELQKAGIAADSIHGDKSQQERLKALEAFKEGSVLVLVATDVAARGLDIDELPHVINFELPRTPEDYIHRIGRTGRAGKPGTAISLVSASEVQYLVEIEKLIRIQVEQVAIPGFEPEYDYATRPATNAVTTAGRRQRRQPWRHWRQHRASAPRAAGGGARRVEPAGQRPALRTSPPTVSTSASLTRARNRIQSRQQSAATPKGHRPAVNTRTNHAAWSRRYLAVSGASSRLAQVWPPAHRRRLDQLQDGDRDVVAVAIAHRARPADQQLGRFPRRRRAIDHPGQFLIGEIGPETVRAEQKGVPCLQALGFAKSDLGSVDATQRSQQNVPVGMDQRLFRRDPALHHQLRRRRNDRCCERAGCRRENGRSGCHRSAPSSPCPAAAAASPRCCADPSR
jgi:ATP-dependent RNA helicase RhlE